LAGAALLVGANLPDVDILSFVAGSDAAIGFRRGWTHGPLAVLILPVALTAFLLAYDLWIRRRKPGLAPARPVRLLGLAYLGCLTHPFLDWLNTYGIRWLMPFDDRWYYGDSVFIIDPWLWLVLGGVAFLGSDRRGFPWGWLILAVLSSLLVILAGERLPWAARAIWVLGLGAIVALRRSPSVRERPVRTAAAGLTLASLYLVAMTVSSAVAASWVRAELDRQGVSPVHRLMVGPIPANPFRRDVLAETPTSYRHGSFRWLPRPALDLHAEPIDKPQPSAVLNAALEASHIQGAISWMRFPFAEIEETADGYTVYLLDARYVRSRTSGFGSAVVELDRQLRVRQTR
jgi:inner membrane protein